MIASSSTSGDRRTRGGVATAALKGAGLIEEDQRMRDLTAASKKTTSGGLKNKSNKKVGHRQRAIDPFKNAGSSDMSNRMLASRITSTLANPLAVRGAAKPASVRIRRGPSNLQVKPIDVWREFVQKRYNSEAKFLNLERIADDEVLKKHNTTPPGLPGSSRKEFPVILKLASQLKPPIDTVSLAHNNLPSGSMIATLAHYLPKLRNLSLQGNQLKTWKDMDYISGKIGKLGELREIVLIDNPIRDFELKNGRAENYRSEMTKRFPSLEVLDQEAITRIAFDVPTTSKSRSGPSGPSSTTFPFPVAPSFVTGVDGSLISNFLTRYFPLFDTQRSALGDVYASNATFSYSAVTVIPPRARVQGFHTSKEMPNQKKLEWSVWLKNSAGGSRNLSRMGGGLDRMVQSLHVGPEEIVRAMSSLPGTHHEISGAADKYCIDAWPVGQGDSMLLFLCIHGEFAEVPSQGIRSFDRSFILAPAPPDSKARLSGWDIIILSDQLTVRAYSSPAAWTPGPLKVQSGSSEGATTAPSTPIKPSRQPPSGLAPEVQTVLNAALASIPEPQRNLVLGICQTTNLNVKYAVECLELNGWDVEKAMANFEQVKGTLPREAFL